MVDNNNSKVIFNWGNRQHPNTKGNNMSNENQNENENQVDERVDVPVNELFGMSVDEWNASQSAWDVLHDRHGLHH
jgi:hypothetical protein|tara:strand:- start:531 stop:758 length:228 start_codon:yes stop_codon:yes gene_type:complete